MKVAVSAMGNDVTSQIDPRFGRCQNFLLVDTDTLEAILLPNGGAMASGGAGIQAAQAIVDSGAQAVISGNMGPNAFQVLAAAGVKVFTGANGSIANAVEMLKRGELQETNSPNVGSHAGMGGGMGRGMGAGGGRSGRGGGR